MHNKSQLPDQIDLEAFLAISDLKAQYFQHLDAKRWDKLRTLFSDDARFEGFAFDVDGGPDEFVATVATFLSDVHSQHQGFLPRTRKISNTRIRAVWTMHDYLTWAPDSRTYKGVLIPGMRGILGYGFYEEEYARTPEGWRISFSRLVRTRIDALVGDSRITPEYDVLGPDPSWLD